MTWLHVFFAFSSVFFCSAYQRFRSTALSRFSQRNVNLVLDDSASDQPIKNTFFANKTFAQLSVSRELIAALKNIKIESPTRIQAICFRDVYKGSHAIIADQTGSGAEEFHCDICASLNLFFD